MGWLAPEQRHQLDTPGLLANRFRDESGTPACVWSQGGFRIGERETLRAHLWWLRHKLEDDPSNPRYIITHAGVGYMLVPDTLGAAPQPTRREQMLPSFLSIRL